MRILVEKEVPRFESYAAERTRGLYNVEAEDGGRFEFEVEIPVDDSRWQIGVVVGPSGSGKTSIHEVLSNEGWHEPKPRWSKTEPIIEVLTKVESYEKATAALAAVGLGSVPSWLRPYGVLSNGEKFRADMARALLSADTGANVLLDEFTSVLDRQVAQVGAGAFAKAWRRKEGRRIVLFTPHYDILEWVQPDWWLDTAEGADEFAADRGVVQAREGAFQSAADNAGYPGDRVGSLEC